MGPRGASQGSSAWRSFPVSAPSRAPAPGHGGHASSVWPRPSPGRRPVVDGHRSARAEPSVERARPRIAPPAQPQAGALGRSGYRDFHSTSPRPLFLHLELPSGSGREDRRRRGSRRRRASTSTNSPRGRPVGHRPPCLHGDDLVDSLAGARRPPQTSPALRRRPQLGLANVSRSLERSGSRAITPPPKSTSRHVAHAVAVWIGARCWRARSGSASLGPEIDSMWHTPSLSPTPGHLVAVLSPMPERPGFVRGVSA